MHVHIVPVNLNWKNEKKRKQREYENMEISSIDF